MKKMTRLCVYANEREREWQSRSREGVNAGECSEKINYMLACMYIVNSRVCSVGARVCRPLRAAPPPTYSAAGAGRHRTTVSCELAWLPTDRTRVDSTRYTIGQRKPTLVADSQSGQPLWYHLCKGRLGIENLRRLSVWKMQICPSDDC